MDHDGVRWSHPADEKNADALRAELEEARNELARRHAERVREIDIHAAEIAELRADVVWAVEHEACSGNLSAYERVIWFSDWEDGDRTVDRVSYDGTDAGLLSAVRRAREGTE